MSNIGSENKACNARDVAIMAKHEFRAPEVIVTGSNCVEDIGDYVGKYGRSALIVTDEVMAKLGLSARLAELLSEKSIECHLYADVNSEPTDTHVVEGAKRFRENDCDLVIGLGGGSCIDAAKAIAVAAKDDAEIREYMGLNKVTGDSAPIIAIPTTAGTGSEVTKVAIITDTEHDVKMLIMDAALTPRVAVVDPLLTLSAPAGITAATGIDALTHAIEAYVSRKAQPLTDCLALSAIRLISGSLRKAWGDGADQEARTNVMIGSLKAGLAFSNASVALVHGMSRPIGAHFHVAHGVSNAVLLPIVMEWSVGGSVERFADIARALGVEVDGVVAEDAAMRAVTEVKRLCEDIEIPSLRELGVDVGKMTEIAGRMAEDAIASGSPGNNPRVPTSEQIVELYMRAIQ